MVAATCLCTAVVAGCAMTPEEIRGVQAENELLREQIAALRERCQQGRELELRREAPVDEAH
jgi:Tfp pilus assembly protein PilN